MAQEDEIDLLKLWLVLVRYKYVILSVAVLTGLAAVAYALVAQPVYRAEVTLAPELEDQNQGSLAALASQFGGLAQMAGVGLPGQGGETQKHIATLKSRKFTDRFIQRNELVPVFFADLWDEQNQQWLVESPEDVPTVRDAYTFFDTEVRFISENPKTGLIGLAIEWHDPELAASWANQLVADINETLRQNTIEESARSIKFLREELEKTNIIDLQRAISHLIEVQMNAAMMANVRDEYAFEVIDPAIPPDMDQFVRPNRMLIAIIGPIGGLFLGLACALLLSFLSEFRRRRAAIEA